MDWNVEEILKEWLRKNGFGGLCNEIAECACSIDGFMECMDISSLSECVPGYAYKMPCRCAKRHCHIGVDDCICPEKDGKLDQEAIDDDKDIDVSGGFDEVAKRTRERYTIQGAGGPNDE